MQLYKGQILYRQAHFVPDPVGRELHSLLSSKAELSLL